MLTKPMKHFRRLMIYGALSLFAVSIVAFAQTPGPEQPINPPPAATDQPTNPPSPAVQPPQNPAPPTPDQPPSAPPTAQDQPKAPTPPPNQPPSPPPTTADQPVTPPAAPEQPTTPQPPTADQPPSPPPAAPEQPAAPQTTTPGWHRFTPQPPPPTAPAAPAPQPDPIAAPVPVPDHITLPAGTFVTIRVDQFLSSDKNKNGDAFSATLSRPLVADGLVIARRGATLGGHVVDAKKAGRVSGVSHLQIALNTLTLADGEQIPVETALTSITGTTSNGRDAAAIATTTAAGAAIGASAAWGTGAAIGGGAGLLAGVVGVLVTRGHPTVIYPESQLTFRLAKPVTFSTEKAPQAFVDARSLNVQSASNQRPPQGPPSLRYQGGVYPPPPYYYGSYYPYFWGPSFGFYFGRGGFYGRGYGFRR